MSAFELVDDTPITAFAVAYQQNNGDPWGVQAQVHATEGAADAAAIAAVVAGTYRACVLKPTGNLFQDVE